jgi:predicted RecB family nuclease
LLQLRIYGWLYEQAVGEPPAALEVHAGTGEIVEIPHDGAEQALAVLERIATLELDPVEPYEPVGWSKCAGCGFHDRCWPAATARRDVALLQSVNQERARALRGAGVVGVEDLLARFDEAGLAALSWVGKPPGAKPRVLGAKAASRLLREARVLADGRDEVLEPLAIPTSSSYAVFDVEGLPAYLDDLEKVYLWGLRVFGASAGPYLAATAGFGEEGDRQGWEAFLAHARSVFERQGDVPFVHWGDYERTRLRLYVQRFGDPGGIAERVLANHHDLCRAAKRSIVLPLPSYGLKVIEQHVGFRRTIPDYSGEEAMADYIEAVETEDETGRERLMGRILAYNEEDLEATWAVLTWLRDRTAGGDAAGPLAAPATPPVDSA